MATKITLKQLSQEVLDLLNGRGGSGEAYLEKEIISNTTCGAAPANTLFPQGQSFTEFAEKLLRKDIIPSITTTFSGSGLKEVGDTVNGTIMTLKINNLSSVTVPITEVKYYFNNVLVETKQYIDGQSTYSYIYNSKITTDSTAKIELIYNGTKLSGEGKFTFVYGSYHGTTALPSITNSDADNLILSFDKEIKASKNLRWDNIILNDERFCYLYPQSLGLLSSIKDGNNFEQLQSYTRYDVTVRSPLNNDNVPYYAYLLTDSATGSGFTQIYS